MCLITYVLRCLIRAFENVECSGVQTLRDELLSEIQKYFCGKDDRTHFRAIEESKFYTIATLLDPRFKKKVCFVLINFNNKIKIIF